MSEFANGNDFNASSSGVGAYIVESPTQVSAIDTMIKASTFNQNFELKKAIQQQKEAEKQKEYINKLATFDTKGIFPSDQDYITSRQNQIVEKAGELTKQYGVGKDISTHLLPLVNQLKGDINALKTRNAEFTKNLTEADKAIADGKIDVDGDKTRKVFDDWLALTPDQRKATPPPSMVLHTETLSDFAEGARKKMKGKTILTVNPDGSTITQKGISDEELAIRTTDVSDNPRANRLMMDQFDKFPDEVKNAYIKKSKDPNKNPHGLEPYQIKFYDDLKVTNGLQVTGVGETPQKKRNESNAAYSRKLSIKQNSEKAGIDIPNLEKMLAGKSNNWLVDPNSPVGEKYMALPGVVLTGKNKDVFAIPKVGLVDQVVNGKRVAVYKIYSTSPIDDKDVEKEGQYYIHRTASPTELLGLIEKEYPALFKKAGSFMTVFNHINDNYGSAVPGQELGLNKLIDNVGKNVQLYVERKKVVPKTEAAKVNERAQPSKVVKVEKTEVKKNLVIGKKDDKL